MSHRERIWFLFVGLILGGALNLLAYLVSGFRISLFIAGLSGIGAIVMLIAQLTIMKSED